MSFGTVIPFSRIDHPAGGALTGRDYMMSAVHNAIEAIGTDPTVLLVIGTGLLLDLGEALPSNVMTSEFIPQRELLQEYVDAFITHHGANSQAEALEAGVPMISWPALGDEIPNARIMMERGAAAAEWDLADPVGTCTPEAMRRAIYQVLDDDRFRNACDGLRKELEAADGPRAAAELILKWAEAPLAEPF